MPQPAQARTRPEKDKIGLVPCVAFAVGTMIGAGVFVLSGIAVQKAGPAALVSFLLAGVLVLLSALSFGVVASRARAGESGYAPSAAHSDSAGGSWPPGPSTSAGSSASPSCSRPSGPICTTSSSAV